MNSVTGTDCLKRKPFFWTPALLALGVAAAWAPSLAAVRHDFGVDVGVQHQVLVERDEGGRRLVRESGPMLRLGFDVGRPLRSGGDIQVRWEIAAGKLNYDGETWAGVPVQSETNLRELDVSVAWRPLKPAQWGEAWLVLRGEWQSRSVYPTPVTGTDGLYDQYSVVLLPGLRWTNSFQAVSWRLQPSVELRASVGGNLDWKYEMPDWPFSRRAVAFGLDVGPVASPWSVGVAWTRTRQSSTTHTMPNRLDYSWDIPVERTQMRFEIDDVMLRVRRAF